MDSRATTEFKIKNNYRFTKKKTDKDCTKCLRCVDLPDKLLCHGRTESECINIQSPVTFTTYENHTCKKFKSRK